jgi:3-methyl-2-oxobutanoate hydroxymethyltransferase
LTPQSYRKLGGFKVQGRDGDAATEILEDAEALAAAGCFAIVLECVPEGLAARITRTIPVPTIGIGAGPSCDGQVLVFHDVMGLSRGTNPRFVRRYADLSTIIEEAARAYTRDVRSGSFPSEAESYADAVTPPLRRVR